VIGWVRAHRALVAFGVGYYLVLLGVGVATGNLSTPIYAVFVAVLFVLGILADLRVRFSRGVLWGWRCGARVAFTGRGAVLVVVLGGTGLGAVNELVEFLISRVVAESKVGGYENTGLDLVANVVGCLAAALWAATRTGEQG